MARRCHKILTLVGTGGSCDCEGNPTPALGLSGVLDPDARCGDASVRSKTGAPYIYESVVCFLRLLITGSGKRSLYKAKVLFGLECLGLQDRSIHP